MPRKCAHTCEAVTNKSKETKIMTSKMLEQILRLGKSQLKHFKGFDILIERDNAPENPRETDKIAKIASTNPNMGDYQIDVPLREYMQSIQSFPFLTLYLYTSNKGILHTTPPSSSIEGNAVGVIYASKEVLNKEWGWKRLNSVRSTEIDSYFRDQVDLYNLFLTRGFVKFEIRKNGSVIADRHNLIDQDAAYQQACKFVADKLTKDK